MHHYFYVSSLYREGKVDIGDTCRNESGSKGEGESDGGPLPQYWG